MENNQEQDVNFRQKPILPPEVPQAVRNALNNTGGVKKSELEIPKYPSEPINLPSEGYFYPTDSPLSSGVVDIKYMTAREEDILSSQNLLKKGVVLTRLLESLIVTPGVNIDELLFGDKNALFVAARRLAYGDKYGPVEITCKHCGESHKKVIDLSVVDNKDFDFSKHTKGQNLFEFLLPNSKKKITYKILTHSDEKSIDDEIKRMTVATKGSSSAASPEITTRLKYMIVSIDGNMDRMFISNFVQNEFRSSDSLAFRTYVRDNTPNIDLTFTFVCDSCSHEERMDIPMGVSFFWPES